MKKTNIKNWFASFVVFTFGAGSLAAEESASRGPSFGFHGGLSASEFETPSDLRYSGKTGFVVGMELELPLFGPLFLQPELSYTQRNFSLLDVAGIHLDGTYGALELPVFAKVKFGSSVHPYVMAGPNFVLNTYHGLSVSSAGQTSSVTFDPRAIDIALNLGAGIEWGALFVSLRYSLGLLGVSPSGGSWRSRGFQGLLGFRF